MSVLKFILSILWDGIYKLGKELMFLGAMFIVLGGLFGAWFLGILGCVWLGHGIIPIDVILIIIWCGLVWCGLIISSGDNPYYQFLDWKDKKYIGISHYFSLKWYKATK